MDSQGATALLRRMGDAEIRVCLQLNRVGRNRMLQRAFTLVSRLGDGVFWYVLLVMIPLFYGLPGVLPALHMGVTALIGIAVYKWLKKRLVRERPYALHRSIECIAPPLDRYSFPSGHTLHAVAFSILGIHYFPELGWLLIPFSLAVATSRVVLGLHYPSDVLVGGLLGAALALAGIVILPGVGPS